MQPNLFAVLQKKKKKKRLLRNLVLDIFYLASNSLILSLIAARSGGDLEDSESGIVCSLRFGAGLGVCFGKQLLRLRLRLKEMVDDLR